MNSHIQDDIEYVIIRPKLSDHHKNKFIFANMIEQNI